MRFITFEKKDKTVRAGWLVDENHVIDMFEATKGVLPQSMLGFIENQAFYFDFIASVPTFTSENTGVYPLSDVVLKAPLPNPRSLRDFYAFEQHVKTAREKRGLAMIPEWYEIPVFYFSNPMTIKGPNDDILQPKQCNWLDYELEIACIIGKQGSDIKSNEAEDYIFGYCIMNDWSARDLQQKEMKVGLGPAKGKDFATSIGPWIVTKDELESFRTEKGYDLNMAARVNGVVLSKGNLKDIHYSFAEMIERASAGVTLYPGEVIGSGTVGSGCILELGTAVHRWLEPGDKIELEITGLGALQNRIGSE